VTEKTGSLVGILYVKETEDLIITCKSGITIRTGIMDIREAGRATQGVTLIRLDDGDEIAAISQIEEEEQENEHNDQEENGTSEQAAGTDTPAENTNDSITDSTTETP
jgi:DNA gyrase subunit A